MRLYDAQMQCYRSKELRPFAARSSNDDDGSLYKSRVDINEDKLFTLISNTKVQM